MDIQLAKRHDLDAIDRANLAESTRKKYRAAMDAYLATGHTLSDTAYLAEYSAALPASGKAFLKAAIRLVARDAASKIKAGATPDNIGTVQASLYRLEAIEDTVQVSSPKGTKVHTWLSQAEVKRLMATCGDDLDGQRDWIVLALLVGAGLRREEIINVTCSDITELPAKKGIRIVLQVQGKGARRRGVPISSVLAERIRGWCAMVNDGNLARSLGRKRELGDRLSAIGVFNIVRKHGAMIGKAQLDPHDLRRTYAQLGYEAGVPITQISRLLGHSSVKTTQTYLNLELDIDTTVSDFIPLE